MKFSKVSNFLVAVSIFLSVGIFVTEASSPRSASASPAGSASGSVSNGYNFCLGVSRTNAAVNVQCITRTTWSSVKSTRTTGYNLQIKGMCLTAPALKDGQDLFASACGTSAATQQDWVGLPNGGIGLIGSNFCLDVEVGIPKDGSPIQIYTCQALVNGTTRIPAQRWVYDQAMFNQSQANAPVTTIAYQPPGRALPPTQQVTTTVYVGPPARGTAVAVPAATTTVYTKPPSQPVVTIPQTTTTSVPLPKDLPKSSPKNDDVLERMSSGGLAMLAYVKWGPDLGSGLRGELWKYLKNMSIKNARGFGCRNSVIAELKRQKYEKKLSLVPSKQLAIYLDILGIVFPDPSVSSILSGDANYLAGVVTKAKDKAIEIARNRYATEISKVPLALQAIDVYLASKNYLITSVPSAAAWAVKLGQSLGLYQLSRTQGYAGMLTANLECYF